MILTTTSDNTIELKSNGSPQIIKKKGIDRIKEFDANIFQPIKSGSFIFL